MKRKQGKKPFENYWMYEVFHEQEQRWQVNLIVKDNISIRTTLSRARYRMSVYLGKLVSSEFEVDHKDNNKLNDNLSNLQLLTKEENKQKQVDFYRVNNPEFIQLSCSMCFSSFRKLIRNYKFHTKRGQINFYCCKSCQYKSMKIQHFLIT